MNKKIGFDIGGTTIEYYVYDEQYNLLKKDGFSTVSLIKEQVITKISEIINELGNGTQVGIASPTAVDFKTGFCKGISGIVGYENFNLYDELKEKITVEYEIFALNDANVALLGMLEYHFDKKPDSAVMVTLGTGVGGALYLNGEIMQGYDNMSGEIGYPSWDNDDTVSAALSPVNLFKSKFNSIDGKAILAKYDTDIDTKEKVDYYMNQMAKFISFMAFTINPEYILLVGGVTNNDLYKELLLKAYEAHLANLNYTGLVTTKIKFLGEKGVNYGAIGAIELIKKYGK